MKKPGLSVCQTYAGAAIHADDLRITAESKDAVSQQANVICNLLKVVRIGRQYKDQEKLNIAGDKTSPLLLNVWESGGMNLSASHAVHENISKARKPFFALGNISGFHGSLNPP